MNYDPVRWCYNCQKPKPRAEFAPVRPGSKRMVCAQCKKNRDEAENRKV